jgi:DNA (cytosine-5)-methyltransferase 1
VLEKNFPHARRFSDINDVHGGVEGVCYNHEPFRPCVDCLTPVDIITGGFPCQDISNAGKRVGIDGERSGLWGEMRRVICEVRPRFVVVENVAALLQRGIERVLGDLAESGYDAEWDCIPASAVGAPHRRDRIWILAYPMRGGGCAEPGQQQGERASIADSSGAGNVADSASGRWPMCGSAPREARQSALSSENVANAESDLRGASGNERPAPSHGSGSDVANTGQQEWRRSSRPGWRERSDEETAGNGRGNGWEANGQWAVEPNVGRVANGIPARVDRLSALGNSLVPQIAEWIGRRIVACHESRGIGF